MVCLFCSWSEVFCLRFWPVCSLLGLWCLVCGFFSSLLGLCVLGFRVFLWLFGCFVGVLYTLLFGCVELVLFCSCPF